MTPRRVQGCWWERMQLWSRQAYQVSVERSYTRTERQHGTSKWSGHLLPPLDCSETTHVADVIRQRTADSLVDVPYSSLSFPTRISSNRFDAIVFVSFIVKTENSQASTWWPWVFQVVVNRLVLSFRFNYIIGIYNCIGQFHAAARLIFHFCFASISSFCSRNHAPCPMQTDLTISTTVSHWRYHVQLISIATVWRKLGIRLGLLYDMYKPTIRQLTLIRHSWSTLTSDPWKYRVQ